VAALKYAENKLQLSTERRTVLNI